MPYASNDALPDSVKNNIPSEKGKRLFRTVVNQQLDRGKSESVSFASAWAALQNAGYEENSNGKWIKKTAVEKAEYDGREVELNKPFRLPGGASKKFGVYVMDGEKVSRVTFGDPNMEIRRDDPEARANFRARHRCDTATDKTSARYWSCRLWSSESVGDILEKEADAITKRAIHDDAFTLEREAQMRSMEMGLNGATHTHETAAGRAVYMPGASHDEYLRAYGAEEYSEYEGEEETHERNENGRGLLSSAIHAIISAILGNTEKSEYSRMSDIEKSDWSVTADICKVDEEQRLAFGFFSVAEIDGEMFFDSEGDGIPAQELEKGAYIHTLNARIASDSHARMGVGDLVETVVFTPEKTAAMVDTLKSMGVDATIDIPAVAWWGGYYISDEAVWEKVKKGEYVAFSIGGKAQRSEYDG